jgi:AcrR family transcriptional regulator
MLASYGTDGYQRKRILMKKARPHAIVKSAGRKPRRSSERAPAGQPVRERILGAAFSAFMEKGYAGTSTLEIASRAKVSKRELYQVCSGKSGLLKEAITERASRMRLPLELPPAGDRQALVAMLTAFGTGVLRGHCEPGVRAVYRLAIAESIQAPEVARVLAGQRNAGRAALAGTLARAQADRLIGAGDPASMSVDFFALLWGDLLLQLLLGLAEPPDPPALEQRARDATEKFLRLYS